MPTSIPAFEKDLLGARILVTGHTGFTGTWISRWLVMAGAEVHGLSLPPPTEPSLFVDTGTSHLLASQETGDVSNAGTVDETIRRIAPDAVLHLAAQPLVRRSYRDPLETYRVNIMGTANVLEAARRAKVRGVVCVTTDKVYANREWAYGYREIDRLGGADPYSASKAAAELVIHSYRQSLLSWGDQMIVAAARGGNIIGGGDWAEDRLIPDIARATIGGEPITLRNPGAVRPWQHVLCLGHGYMLLLARIIAQDEAVSDAWNLGPATPETMTVGEVVEQLRRQWPALAVSIEPSGLHETDHLALDSCKAQRELAWRPGWSMTQSIDHTGEWYAHWMARGRESAAAITDQQIQAYRHAVMTG